MIDFTGQVVVVTRRPPHITRFVDAFRCQSPVNVQKAADAARGTKNVVDLALLHNSSTAAMRSCNDIGVILPTPYDRNAPMTGPTKPKWAVDEKRICSHGGQAEPTGCYERGAAPRSTVSRARACASRVPALRTIVSGVSKSS
jgi:hypothetical protein